METTMMRWMRDVVREEVPAVAESGGAPAAVEPAATTAAPATAPATEAPATEKAPAAESLLRPPPKEEAAAADAAAFLPEKFVVKSADGSLDLTASAKKLAESYTHLEKSRGPVLPPTPNDYKFTPPERFAAIDVNDPMFGNFKEAAHKHNLTQAQYEFVMSKYFEIVPEVMGEATRQTAAEARAELQKVWSDTQTYEAGVANAQRAIDGAPADIREQVYERYGHDPLFLRFAAAYGSQMKEDRPPNPGVTQAGGEVQSLMVSEAYRNPRHPDHARVSAQVQSYFQRLSGMGPSPM